MAGARKCLQRLVRLDMPVPLTIALSFGVVREIATGAQMSLRHLLGHFPDGQLLSVRPSAEHPQWGGPAAILNIGMNDAMHAKLAAHRMARTAATALYLRFVQSFAQHVARLDPDMFDADRPSRALSTPPCAPMKTRSKTRSRKRWRSNWPMCCAPWRGPGKGRRRGCCVRPRGPRSMPGWALSCRPWRGAWASDTAPRMRVAWADPVHRHTTGAPEVKGRFRPDQNGSDEALFLTCDPRGPSLEDRSPQKPLRNCWTMAPSARKRLREEMEIEFTLEDGKLWILDAVTVPRSSRAAVRVAVDLANDGVILRDDAIMRVAPKALGELLHRQVDTARAPAELGRGIAASPGAAVGRLVFSSAAALASAARDEPCILARRETTPEDIRGMHSAHAVLTERGGMTSHAAVIGRGLGVPCVVGASNITLTRAARPCAPMVTPWPKAT